MEPASRQPAGASSQPASQQERERQETLALVESHIEMLTPRLLALRQSISDALDPPIQQRPRGARHVRRMPTPQQRERGLADIEFVDYLVVLMQTQCVNPPATATSEDIASTFIDVVFRRAERLIDHYRLCDWL